MNKKDEQETATTIKKINKKIIDKSNDNIKPINRICRKYVS